MAEKIIETKTCKHCQENFDITDKDLEFYDKISPVFKGIKYSIPAPTLCPLCRDQRRYAFRNERYLYKRNSDASGKNIISVYSPDKKYTVYSPEEWFQDNWDSLDYSPANGIDFEKPFFDQLNELISTVPLIGLANTESENSAYNNYVKGIKNCYMSSVIYMGSEDIYYSSWIYTSKNIFDGKSVFDSEVCYELHDCRYCYNCFYVHNCSSCNHCYFSRNLNGCNNCLFCVNLQNKEYHIFNKQVSKEEFNEYVSKLFSGSHDEIEKTKKEFNDFSITKPFIYANLTNCENSTGDNLFNSRNSHMCFDLVDIEDCKYCTSGITKDSYDGLGGENNRCYEFSRVGWSNNVLFTFDGVQCNNVILCFSVYNSSDLFGCVGLKNKQYCIFNKQYAKEEYEELVPQIIEHMKKTGEWGEFLPSSISPFGYNETAASEFYPISKNEAIDSGFNWSDYENPKPDVAKIIPASKLPDNIKDIPDDIINWAIECELSGKPFRIIKQELDFYRKYNIPIPRMHPNQRHINRMNKRNPRKLYDRECQNKNCAEINNTADGKPAKFKTNYSPERKEKVYCKECYEKEII